jgi:hypothetical protein
MRSAAELSSLTRDFPLLQGLRIVPYGAAFATSSVLAAESGSGTGIGLPLLLLMGAAIAERLAARYYANEYGKVVPIPRPRAHPIVGVLLLATWAAAFAGDTVQVAPISLHALWWALYVGSAAFLARGTRLYYSAAAAALLAVSLAPLIPGVSIAGMFGHDFGGWAWLLVGLVLIVLGALDHRRLVQEFRHPAMPEGLA